jgi:hypothetical protein
LFIPPLLGLLYTIGNTGSPYSQIGSGYPLFYIFSKKVISLRDSIYALYQLKGAVVNTYIHTSNAILPHRITLALIESYSP